MSKQAQYCLFFSFKGGVGRTSAMMNTARHLAKQKKRVLCIDFDLAAPGIDIFDRIDGAGRPSYNPTKYMYAHDGENFKYIYDSLEGKKKFKGGHIPLNSSELDKYKKNAPKGFLEFVRDYLQSIKENKASPKPELTYPTKLKKINTGNSRNNDYLFLLPKDNIREGDIVMMRVCNHDDDTQFSKLLDEVDVSKLGESSDNNSEDSEPEFVQYFKNQINEKINPDYVLVDGRPGMDPISILAMKWFSDCVVLAFNLNPWNLNGIISIYKERVLNSPCQKNKPNVLLLASPVPEFAQRSDLYSNQFKRVKEEMRGARNSGADNKPSPIEVPQTDILLLRDVLICDVEPQHMACNAYYELTKAIISGNKNDIQNAINQALSFGRESEKKLELESLRNRYINNEAIEYEYGKFYLSIGREYKAIDKFKSAIDIIKSQKDTGKTSPYTLDATFEYVKSIYTIATHEINNSKKPVYSNKTIIKSLREKIENAFKELKNIGESENIIADKKNPAIAPYLSLKAGLLLITGQLGFSYNEKNDSVSIDKGNAVDTLEEARKLYDDCISLVRGNAGYYFGRATANIYLISFDNKNSIKKAITDLEESSKNKIEFNEAIFKAGLYYFSLSIKKGNIFFPVYEENISFLGEEVEEYASQPNCIICDPASLEQAEKKMITVISKHESHSLAHYYLGLISLIKTTLTNVESEKLKHYKNSINYFSSTSLHNPSFALAYLYSGLAQFLINDLEDKKDNLVTENIRFRQAFYRMEHFIQLSFKEICGISDKKNEDREPFYFDGEPGKDIDTIIDTFKEGKYNFPLTLEKRLGIPSIIDILRPEKEYSDQYDQSFIDMIKNKI